MKKWLLVLICMLWLPTVAVASSEERTFVVNQATSLYSEANVQSTLSDELTGGEQVLAGEEVGQFTNVNIVTDEGKQSGYILTETLSPNEVIRFVHKETQVYDALGKVVGHVKFGQELKVWDEHPEKPDWLYVRSLDAYVPKSSLQSVKPTVSPQKMYVKKNTKAYEFTGSSYQVRANYRTGMSLNVYGTVGEYARVKWNGTYAYVLRTQLSTKNTATTTSTLTTVKPLAYESTGTMYSKKKDVDVYVRTYDFTTTVGKLAEGESVQTAGRVGYYTRILYKGSYRYVASGYLSYTKPAPKLPAGTVFYVQVNATPYFYSDVAYSKPAGTLSRGTKLIGLYSIDDDFWKVKVASTGQIMYVTNPYIATTRPLDVKRESTNPRNAYRTTKKTPFYANPYSKTPLGYFPSSQRLFPRGKYGDSYLVQFSWRPVYVKTSAITVSQDTLISSKSTATFRERLITYSSAYLGTPYTWGSQSPLNGGFDCSGLIHYAVNKAGKPMARTNVYGYWTGSQFTNKRTDIASGKRGDIVFFAGTYRPGPSHIGIMLNGEYFIHAGGDQLQISSLKDPVWRKYFLGYKSP